MSLSNRSTSSAFSRRELRDQQRSRARRRRLGSGIATVTVAALLALGLPVGAMAEEPTTTDPAVATQSAEPGATESSTEGDSAETAPPAETTPAEEPPAEEPPADSEAPIDSPAPVESTEGESTEGGTETDDPEQSLRQAVPDDAGTDIGTMSVPAPPGPNDAVVTVRTGDTRSQADPDIIAPLPGVQLGLYSAQTGGTLLFSCTADAQGDCSFIVPNTNTNPPAGNRDREMWVRQIAAPGGYFTNPQLRTGDAFGGANQSTTYSFRVGNASNSYQIRPGQTYTTTPPAEFMVSSGNDNRVASGGIWQTSRNNPTLPQQCGLDVALIMDLSGSVNPSIVQAREAAKTLVNSLVGTPSRVGLFTFAQGAPANNSNNQNRPISPVSTAPLAATVNGWIDGLTAPTNGTTNWDRGLYQVATSATQYDVAIILTDGNPTVYGTESNPGDFTRVREVENAIFSANAIKAEQTRVIALGVGSGVSAPSTALNLRAISGNTAYNGSNSATADYYQTENYAAAGDAMRQLALGNCQGSVSVIKQVVPPNGNIAQAQPAGGWAIGAGSASAGITVGSPNPANGQTEAGTGSISYPLNFAGGTSNGTVTIRETLQGGFTHLPQSGVNAVCRDLNTGNVIAGVTNASVVAGQPGVVVPVSTTTAVSCTFYNQQPNPAATLVVNKFWVINGQPAVPHGQTPSLTGNATLNGATTGFGEVAGGFSQGQTVQVNESLGQLPTTCVLNSKTLTKFNGANQTTDLANGNFGALLVAGANTAEITNTVTCPTKLTLRKDVDGDGVPTNLWTLDALTPSGGIPFAAGNDSGAGVTGDVTPGLVYPLAESGGDPRYIQVDNRDPVLSVPGSTGSWACVPLDANGNPTGGNAGGLNGGVIVGFGTWTQCTAVNQTAKLTLEKQVQPLAGVTSDPNNWDLTAAPQNPQIPGLNAQTVKTGTQISIRPNKGYNLSESLVAGFEQVSLQCNIGNGFVDATSVTLPPNANGICRFVNRPIPPKLWLVKVVSPAGAAEPSSWTVNASIGGNVVTGGAGGNGGYVNVPAGQAIALSETTALPGGDDFTASWQCSGGDLTGTTLAALEPGDAVICTVTNTLEPVIPSIVKTAAIPVPQPNGSWNITYDIVVTNPSPFLDLTYELADDLNFGSSVTVNSASYQRTLPAPPGASTPFSAPITGPQQFAGEPTLAKGTSHTWRVTVNATVAPGANFGGSSESACDTGTPGTVGFLNTATMVVNGTTYPAQDCELPVKPSLLKVGGTAVDNGDGTWMLPYTITVTNPSSDTGVIYDLVDALDLPAGVSATGPATVFSAPPGVTPVPGWTGSAPNTLLANDVLLPGTAGVDQHVYEIRVTVELDAEDGPFTCPSPDGLNNVATVTSGNQTAEATGCVVIETPDIVHSKIVVPGSVSQGADGLWTITYEIEVENTDDIGGTYTLADELHFGAGIDLAGATYAVTLNGVAGPLAWSGSGDLVVDRYLAGGASDVWRIVVGGIAVDGPQLTPTQTACPSNDADGAFNNAAVLTVAGEDAIATDCDAPSAPTVVKSNATAMQQPDASWNVSYTITVSNTAPGAKPSFYNLSDLPQFPAGVEYVSYSIDGGAPVSYDGGEITIASNMPIAAGATVVYTIVLNVDVPSGAVPNTDRECVPTAPTPYKGFFNTAVLKSGEIVDDDTECIDIEEGGVPSVLKDDATATQDDDGVWTVEYDVTVTGNAEFISKYTLSDTLRFAPEVDVLTAEWEQLEGGSESGSWTDPEADPTTEIVPTPTLIGIDEVHVFHITVTAEVAEAFDDPPTNTCQPSEEEPNVGFLNEALLVSGTTTQISTDCTLPAEPEIVKTSTGPAVQDGDEWQVSYTVTVRNLNPEQELVYDLEDEPDFSDSVTITDREVESSDVAVNPAWNAVPPTTDTIVSNEELAGGETHTFTVTVWFTVDADAEGDDTFLCEGEGGQGLLNTATVISGDEWSSDDCEDVPVIVILEKLWEIDGGEPIAWNDPDLPDGFTAQALLDEDPVDWGDETGPYAYQDEVEVDETDVEIPEGCELTDSIGTGLETLENAVNTFTVTNVVDCVQTVNLEKIVVNQYGGDAVFTDWMVSASTLEDGFGGPGQASGIVDLNIGYALNEVSTEWEDGVEYEVQSTWSCSSEQGEDAFTLIAEEGSRSATLTVTQLGATVDCEIVNTDIAPTLELVKHVEPEEIEADYPPTLWTLTAWDGDTAVLEGEGGAGPAQVDSNTGYALTESADFPYWELFEAGPWQCVVTDDGDAPADLSEDVVTLLPGQDVRCDITNTAPEFDVALEKTYELAEGETAVESGDEFEWVLTVTNLADAVTGLEVTDLVDPTLEVTGPATFDPAPGWTQTSGDTDNAFSAEYAGLYPEGYVTEIRIPVRMLPEPPIETPPAVDPIAPPPVVPPLDTSPIPNQACVAITGPLTEEPEVPELAALDDVDADLPPILQDVNPEDNCDDAEVPVKRIQPAAYVRCIADVPWLYYDIQVTENVEPGDITVTWTSGDGTLTEEFTIPWDERSGRLLWPGAAVDENGVPYQFPGWRPITEQDLLDPGSVVPGTRFLDLILDETVPTYPWRDMENPSSITFSVNPSQTVLAVYPMALPACAIDRPPLLDIVKTASVQTAPPGSSFSYTLSVTSTGIGAADPVEIFDEIPADIRVNTITTDPAPAFPRWESCEVTGKDSQGYGGALHCVLNGVLGPNITAAPPITLGVTLRPSTKATSITNTGEVCYQDADATDEPPVVLCADSSVKVNVPQPLAGTGFNGDWRWYAAVLILLGGLVVTIVAIRRRKGATTDDE